MTANEVREELSEEGEDLAPANEAGSVFEIQVEGMGGENPKGFEPSRRFRE